MTHSRVAAALDWTVACALLAVALLYAVSALAFIEAYGWREPMFDQWRQYLPLLERAFPHNVLVLENGHRPVLPNLLRLADIHFGQGDQSILIHAGMAFALATVAIVAAIGWREQRLVAIERAAITALACIAVLYLGNARMLMHGNEAVQVYLATTAVAAALWFVHRAASGRPVAQMAAASVCAMVATFSFGSGIAAFPALLVVGWIVRVPWRGIAVCAALMLLTLFLYLYAMPGDDGVRNVLHFHPVESVTVAACWLGAPWVNAWLGLADPEAGEWLRTAAQTRGIGAWLVASASAVPMDAARWQMLSSGVIGATGIALVLVGAWRRRTRILAVTRVGVLGLGLAMFACATAAVIGLVRLELFREHPGQIFAERYGVWPCLFWLGVALLAIDRKGDVAKPARRFTTAIATLALAALLWPTHAAWRGWGIAVYQRGEQAAASIALGVRDPLLMPSAVEVDPAILRRVVDAFRARRLAMFRAPHTPVGTQLGSDLDLAAHVTATLRVRRSLDVDGTGLVAFAGWLDDPRRLHLLDELFVIDEKGLVVGVARWSHDPRPIELPLVPRPKFFGLDGYALAGPGSRSLAARDADTGTLYLLAELPRAAAAP